MSSHATSSIDPGLPSSLHDGSQHSVGETEPGNPTLWPKSLHNLATVIGDDGGTKLAMYLNIPTTTLINIRLNGVLSDHTEQLITSTILVYWKMMREKVSDGDLIADLKQALTNIDRPELAEAIGELYSNEEPLTVENLPPKPEKLPNEDSGTALAA